ncbi:MAG TPA: MarR family transcriptional regulator [Solirubrobacteraceae bacterium]
MPLSTRSIRKTEALDQPLRDEPEAELPARLRAAIGRLSRRLRHTAASSGLTPSEISVLLTIARRGPLRLSELAEIEAINPTMLSRITGRLCELQLIRRSPDPEDRRAALVDATAAGRRMRKRIHSERTAVLQAHLEGLDRDEQATLEAALPLLERLAESIKDAQPTGEAKR